MNLMKLNELNDSEPTEPQEFLPLSHTIMIQFGRTSEPCATNFWLTMDLTRLSQKIKGLFYK